MSKLENRLEFFDLLFFACLLTLLIILLKNSAEGRRRGEREESGNINVIAIKPHACNE